MNKGLKEINLERNYVSFYGAFCLSDALKHNATLKVLCLDDNQIRDEGCKAICDAMIISTLDNIIDLNNDDNDSLCNTFDNISVFCFKVSRTEVCVCVLKLCT